jgi:hypothetical protein
MIFSSFCLQENKGCNGFTHNDDIVNPSLNGGYRWPPVFMTRTFKDGTCERLLFIFFFVHIYSEHFILFYV